MQQYYTIDPIMLISELLDEIDRVTQNTRGESRQTGALLLKSLEKRILTLKSIYTKDSLIYQILTKLYNMHISPLFFKLESAIDDLETNGFTLKIPPRNNENLTIFEKFQIVQNNFIAEGVGAIFNPEIATRDYQVNFMELEYLLDYKSSPSVSIGADGARPDLAIYFTDSGIAKLLNTNEKMRGEVEKLYQEFLENIES